MSNFKAKKIALYKSIGVNVSLLLNWHIFQGQVASRGK